MNFRALIVPLLLAAVLTLVGCGPIQIPTDIPIPTALPEFPTFPPPDDGGEPTSAPPPADENQPTPEGSIPVTGEDPQISILLLYALVALLGVLILFGFIALLRRPDRPYHESPTDRGGNHD
jgi:hypothetical protein